LNIGWPFSNLMMLFCMLCVLDPIDSGILIFFKKGAILKPNGGGDTNGGAGVRFRFFDIGYWMK